MKFIFIFYVSFGVLISKNAFGEVFTAIIHMTPLLKTQEFLITGMKNYITETELILDMLRSYLELVKEEYREAKKGINEYLSNPLNAYLLTKRLTSDWQEVEELMTRDIGNKTIENVNHHRTKNLLLFPTEEDLNGAAIAILRLQSVYNLKTSSLAKGEIKESRLSNGLSSSDCFEIGRQCYIKEYYHCTRDWMMEAMHRYYDEVNKTSSEYDILNYLSYSTFMEGDIEFTAQLFSKLLKLSSVEELKFDNEIFGKGILNNTKLLEKKRKKSDHEITIFKETGEATHFRQRTKYEKLCRNELRVSEKIRAKLKCRYVDFGRPFLKLARVKEEEAYLNPRVVLYHEVLSDREIQAVKRLSILKLSRAGVFNSNATDDPGYVDYRIGKVAWLRDFEHPRVAAISRRIEDITGLDMEFSEELQVVNYGIGGHYDPHFDFAQDQERDSELSYYQTFGDRIATFLFYMSDVQHGGGTVFPVIDLTVLPKKGSAILWYNLEKNGERNFLMKHASCPVLLGSKWICNKWILERGQEFRRSCGLHYDD